MAAVPNELDPSASAAAVNAFNCSSVAGRFFFGSYSISSPTNGFAPDTIVGAHGAPIVQASLHTKPIARRCEGELAGSSTFRFRRAVPQRRELRS
jgi:hypothetical protein